MEEETGPKLINESNQGSNEQQSHAENQQKPVETVIQENKGIAENMQIEEQSKDTAIDIEEGKTETESQSQKKPMPMELLIESEKQQCGQKHDHPHQNQNPEEHHQLFKFAEKEELLLIQRQTDKIYEDFSITVEIFGECVSYLKSKFNEEFCENAKEKLELKINNSIFLYKALSKEASKHKTSSQILLENLAKKKKVILERFESLQEPIKFFGLAEQYDDFVSILTDKPVEQYQFKEITFENLSEEKLGSIGNSINELLAVFSQATMKKEKEVLEDKIPTEQTHQNKIDHQISGFLLQTSHAPDVDVNFLVKKICEENNVEEYSNIFKRMIQENFINLDGVNGIIEKLQTAKKPVECEQNIKLEELVLLLSEYKHSGSPLK